MVSLERKKEKKSRKKTIKINLGQNAGCTRADTVATTEQNQFISTAACVANNTGPVIVTNNLTIVFF